MIKVLKILVFIFIAAILLLIAGRLFESYSKRVDSKEAEKALKTFTLTEFLFPTNDVSGTATAQSAVALLLTKEIKHFITSSSAQNVGQRAAETFRAVNAAVEPWPPADAEVLLAQLAAGLTRSDDTKAEQVAGGLMTAATAEQRPSVIAYIALATTGLDTSTSIIRTAVNAAPSTERNALRKIAAAPMQQLGAGADVAALRIVKTFHLLGNHWNPADKPTTLFQDSDGGEHPALRH